MLKILALISTLWLLQQSPSSVASDADYIVEQINPDIHVLRQQVGVRESVSGNVVVIKQTDGLVLVDSGYSSYFAAQIIRHVERVYPKMPVHTIVITHWHDDHLLGLPTLKDRWPGAKVISTHATRSDALANYGRFAAGRDDDSRRRFLEAYKSALKSLKKRASDPNLDPELARDYRRTAEDVSRTLEARQDQRLSLPELTIEKKAVLHDEASPIELINFGPANTSGDLIAWLPRSRIVVAGDIVVFPMPYGFGSHAEPWRKVLREISNLDPALVVPGHGQVLRGTDYFDRLDALIAQTHSIIIASIDEGLGKERIVDRLVSSGVGDSFSGKQPFHRELMRKYWFVPMVEGVFSEAEQERSEHSDQNDR